MVEMIEKIATFLQTNLDVFGFGAAYSPAAYVAIFGSGLVLVAFLVALIVKANSRVAKTTKDFADATVYVEKLEIVDEENVEHLNKRINVMAEPVQKGWGRFLAQQAGYPSDYITEKEILADAAAVPKHNGARGFFTFVSWLIIVIGILLTAIGGRSGLSGAAGVTESILAVAGAVCGPILVYIVFVAVLRASCRKQIKKLCAEIRAFQDAMDNAVLLYQDEQDEFISENIEEINATIEQILANRLENREIIEIVTTPQVSEELEYEPEEEEEVEEEDFIPEEPEPVVISYAEPVEYETVEEEEIVEEEEELVYEEEAAAAEDEVAAAAAEEVQEEEEEDAVAAAIIALQTAVISNEQAALLAQLVNAVDSAVSDPRTPDDVIAQLTFMLNAASTGGDFESEAEQKVFAACFTILAAEFFRRNPNA